jgi:hypothetical protein
VIPDTSSESAALAWLRDKWDGFVALGEQFRPLMHRAAVVAAASSDPATKETARQTIERLSGLWDLHAVTVERARGIAGLVGLGAVLWPAAVIAVALSVAWIWTRYDAEYRVVSMLEAGRVTPEEARRILAETEGGGPSFSAGFGSAGLLVAGLAGLWVWKSGRRAS